MKQKLRNLLAALIAISVLCSVTFTVSAKPQSTNDVNGKRIEISSGKKTVDKNTSKKSNVAQKTKKSLKNKTVLNKLKALDKKVINVEANVDKLSKQINLYINSNAAVIKTTTEAAIKTCKGASPTGFVNGTRGKLNALSKKVNAIEKSLKSIKADSANVAKYNELAGRLNTIKSKINAETTLLNSLTAKK